MARMFRVSAMSATVHILQFDAMPTFQVKQ